VRDWYALPQLDREWSKNRRCISKGRSLGAPSRPFCRITSSSSSCACGSAKILRRRYCEQAHRRFRFALGVVAVAGGVQAGESRGARRGRQRFEARGEQTPPAAIDGDAGALVMIRLAANGGHRGGDGGFAIISILLIDPSGNCCAAFAARAWRFRKKPRARAPIFAGSMGRRVARIQ